MLNFLIKQAVSGLFGGEDEPPPPPPPPPEPVLDEELLIATIKDSLKTLDEYEKQCGRDLVAIMRHEAGNMSGEFALQTPPLDGNPSKAKERIKEDVNMIFRPLQDIPFAELVLAKEWPAVTAYNFKFESERLRKAYDDGNWDLITKAFLNGNGGGEFSAYSGQDITVIDSPNKKFHKMARDKNGRLNGRRFHVSGDDASQKIDSYAALAAQAIGQMAGGWVYCYIKLNGTGYNLPIDYAKRGKGYVQTKWWGDEKVITVKNELGNFGGFISQRSGKFSSIVDSAAERVKDRYVANAKKLLEIYNMK